MTSSPCILKRHLLITYSRDWGKYSKKQHYGLLALFIPLLLGKSKQLWDSDLFIFTLINSVDNIILELLLSLSNMLLALFDEHYSKGARAHCLAMNNLTKNQRFKIKRSTVDSNTQLNKLYSSFNRLHKELSLDFCLVDIFPDYFYFHIANKKDPLAFKTI